MSYLLPKDLTPAWFKYPKEFLQERRFTNSESIYTYNERTGLTAGFL